MPNIQERLIDCFSTVFPNLSPEEIPRAGTASVATWDSLAAVTLVSVVEEEFGITVAPDEYDYMFSFESILEYLKGKAANA